ncbi:MAG: hypothetical protein AAF614_37665 [Chloroflexota bacterium]
MNNDLPRLQILEFERIEGEEIYLEFKSGLTILHGKSATDRTLLLRLIRYAMGRNASRIDPDFLAASKQVTLKLLANGQKLIFSRSCRQPTAQITIYDDDREYRGRPRSVASKVLIDKLALPTIELERSTSPDPLSFNDIAYAFVIDRDLSYGAILNELYPKKRAEVIRVMMGLTNSEIARKQKEIQEKQKEQENLKQRIIALEEFLTDFDVSDLGDMERRKHNLNEALEQITLQELELNKRIEEQISQSHQGKRYKNLLSKLSQVREQFNQNERERANLIHQRQEKLDLKLLLEQESRRLQRHLISKHVVSTFTFSQCPRCQQRITLDMQAREQSGDCMLCNRPFVNTSFDSTAWNKAVRDTNQLVKEADELLHSYEENITQLDKEQPSLKSQINELESTLERTTHNYIAPLAEDIRLLSYQRYAILKSLGELEDEIKQRNYVIKKAEEELPNLQQKLDELLIELEQLEGKLGAPAIRYNAFLHHFRYFMRSIASVKPFKSASSKFEKFEWDSRDFEPLIDGKSYKDVASGPNMAVTIQAFHYSLLAMSVAKPNVSTNHPKLLLLDEPEQQKMPHEWAQKILELFAELALNHKDKLQVIIATRTEDIPKHLKKYAMTIDR